MQNTKQETIAQLLEIMRALRDPSKGCPWDCKQTYASITPYTLEEVYEVIEAIENHDYQALKDELGDLLFQVVFYAQIASEEGRFGFYDVVEAICDKLKRRHPHVFDGAEIRCEEALHRAWEKQKHLERQEKQKEEGVSAPASLMDDIPKALPELKRAQKMQKRAAKQGFDWPAVPPVLDKIEEELKEVREAIDANNPSQIEEEIGDLLFAVVNLARHTRVDADSALRKANRKFSERFRALEAMAGYQVDRWSLEELEAFWQAVKAKEVAT